MLGLFRLNASSFASAGDDDVFVDEDGDEGEGGPLVNVLRRCELLVDLARALPLLGLEGWAEALLVNPPVVRGVVEDEEETPDRTPLGTGAAFSRVADMEGRSRLAAIEGRLPMGVVRPFAVMVVRGVTPEEEEDLVEEEACSSICFIMVSI